jgi:hypothetical protein
LSLAVEKKMMGVHLVLVWLVWADLTAIAASLQRVPASSFL